MQDAGAKPHDEHCMRWKQCQAQDSPFNRILISSRIESLPSLVRLAFASSVHFAEYSICCLTCPSATGDQTISYITSGSLADGVHHDVTPRLWPGLVGADPLDTR